MKKKINNFVNVIVVSLLLLGMLSSCTPSLTPKKEISREKRISESARAIDHEYNRVRDALIESGEYSEEEFLSYGTLNGETVTRGAIEDGCENVLLFLSAAYLGDDIDSVLSTAKPIVPDSDYQMLIDKVDEIKSEAKEYGKRATRSLAPGQKAEFYKELNSMVTKTVVLLTASIVYAFMPKTMFWGKVSAATAISIAAGVVTASFISLIEVTDPDVKDDASDFSLWLESVSAEPFAAWAIAQGMLNTQMAIVDKPVQAAIVLAVFAIYQFGEKAKVLLTKYNFKA